MSLHIYMYFDLCACTIFKHIDLQTPFHLVHSPSINCNMLHSLATITRIMYWSGVWQSSLFVKLLWKVDNKQPLGHPFWSVDDNQILSVVRFLTIEVITCWFVCLGMRELSILILYLTMACSGFKFWVCIASLTLNELVKRLLEFLRGCFCVQVKDLGGKEGFSYCCLLIFLLWSM